MHCWGCSPNSCCKYRGGMRPRCPSRCRGCIPVYCCWPGGDMRPRCRHFSGIDRGGSSGGGNGSKRRISKSKWRGGSRGR